MPSHSTIPQAPFHRPDGRGIACELIRVFPGWENERVLPMGYHRHEFHELVWLVTGQSQHEVDFCDYTVEPAQVLMIPRGSVHRFDGGERCFGGTLLFADDFLTSEQADTVRAFQVFDPLLTARLLTPTQTERVSLRHLLREMSYEQAQPTAVGGNTLLQSLLVAVLHKLETVACRGGGEVPTAAAVKLYQRFRSLLEAHYEQPHDVGFYASALRCSPRQLADALRATRGVTTRQLIIDRQLLEAKRYLSYTDQRVSEIAYRVGFEDPAYFSRLFRLKTGQSAEGFRAQLTRKSS